MGIRHRYSSLYVHPIRNRVKIYFKNYFSGNYLDIESENYYVYDMLNPRSREFMLQEIGIEGKRCVEVGVFRADFSVNILALNPLKLFLIDPWRHQCDTIYPDDVCNVQQREFDDICDGVVRRVGGDSRVNIARAFSQDVARELRGAKFDFVYIDAIHTHTSCLQDMEAWWLSVSDGGWMCGHDYDKHGVKAAVDSFLSTHPEAKLDLLTRDFPPSWGIQKPAR